MTTFPNKKVLPPSPKDTAPKFFYGYIIVIFSFLCLLIMHGITSSYGIFLVQIQNQTQWDRATISGASSLAFFLTGLFAIVSGRLVDKYGPRFVMTISGIILGAGYLLVSQISTVWQLYLAYGVITGIGMSSADVTTMATTARWFTKRRGLMTSIMKTGSGLGMLTIPLLSGWLFLQHDWRTAYIVLGILAFVVIVGSAIFLKRDPSQTGQQPYGFGSEQEQDLKTNKRDLLLRDIFRTQQFWLVCGVYFLTWYITQSVMVHLPSHMEDYRLTVAQTASIMATIGGVSILGRLAMGALGDRIGNCRAIIICCFVLLTAIIWLQFVQNLWESYIFAIVYGFAHGGFFSIVSPLTAELFGLSSHGSNLGLLLFIGQSGGAMGAIVTGRIFDINQSYQLAFYVLLGAAIVGLILTWLLEINVKREIARRGEKVA